jgi:putative ABC transport system permease protein
MFAIMLVSANTMAMSVRSRTREVAVLKTLGFTQMRVLSMFVSESMALAITGGVFGVVVARFVIAWLTHQFIGLGIPLDMKVNGITAAIALLTALMLGIISGYLPAHRASRMNIVDALRHIG